MHAHQEVAEYSAEEFAGMMNRIISKASKMRVVMNKLGISDTDSVKAVEAHFIKLGKEHTELGEGTANEEEMRLRGLQARSCVKKATSCSREAAGCDREVKYCKSVIAGCTQAASACGISNLGEAKENTQHTDTTHKKTEQTIADDQPENRAHEKITPEEKETKKTDSKGKQVHNLEEDDVNARLSKLA